MFRSVEKSDPQHPERGRSHSGLVLIASIFAFALVLLIALFKAPHALDSAPSSASWKVPARVIPVVSFDFRSSDRPIDELAELVKRTGAEVVFVQRVPADQLALVGTTLGMSRASGAVYYPAQNIAGASAPFGNAIFSKLPLYESRSIPSRAGSFGVWAIAVDGDAKFMVSSINFSEGQPDSADVTLRESEMLLRAWKELGSVPMVIGARGSHSTLLVSDSAESGSTLRTAGDENQRLVGMGGFVLGESSSQAGALSTTVTGASR